MQADKKEVHCLRAKVTIKDVAAKAGVSISTVSRVVNGLDRVSDETRERVMATMEELQFQPDKIAVSMVKGKTNMIAVVVPEIVNSFYSSVVHGVETIARKHGYHVLICSSNNSTETERELASSAFLQMADGVIVMSASHNQQFYQQFDNRVVLVDRLLPSNVYDAVVIDNYGGGYQMGMHLLSKGHRRIGFINGEETFNVGRDRRDGFFAALKLANVACDESLIHCGSWDEQTGFDGMERFANMEQPPTAVFCTNNHLCFGAVRYFATSKLTIGDRISLAGFDDSIVARCCTPEITVIERPTIEMGEKAMKMLLNKLENPEEYDSTSVISMKVKLVERDSVRDLISNPF